jgi:hypothetical protein
MSKRIVWRDIHGEKILDSWSTIIKGAEGKANKIFERTIKRIEEANIPVIKCQMVEVENPRLSRAFREWRVVRELGEEARTFVKRKRDFLMVTNAVLKDYRMYVGARDFGKNLDVSWYLTCEPKYFKKAISYLTTGSEKAIFFGFDPFDFQDLQAYVTVVHRSLLEAVSELMQELDQDPSKIDRKSKGFLGVS